MSAFGGRVRGIVAVVAFPLAMLGTTGASAQDLESPMREAGKHFQRGVTLYGEADYRAALVEFKRAFVLAPNAAVLYNVGETEYQLQDYAGALITFRRYLAESAANEPHRNEVESNVEVLRTRVGHVNVTTTPPGADVTIDDQSIGKTPLDEPAIVSIGHRKVVASLGGRNPVTRYVDVAADDNISLALQLVVPAEALSATARTAADGDATGANGSTGKTLRIVGWVSTGILAAGAVTFGVLANMESSDLKTARNTFPTTGATLNHDASLTGTYAVLADSLTAAAVVVGGITLFSTLSASSSGGSSTRGSAGDTRVTLGPGSARLEMKF